MRSAEDVSFKTRLFDLSIFTPYIEDSKASFGVRTQKLFLNLEGDGIDDVVDCK